jgi:triacylglycerol lipase
MGHVEIMLANILRLLVVITLVCIGVIAVWLKTSFNDSLIGALLCAVLIAFVFIAAFMAVQGLLSWVYGSPSPPGHQLTGVKVLKPWWGELLACVHVFFWLQPFFGDKKLASGRDKEKPALLLVHGYFCNRALWTGFAKPFAAEGHIIGSVNLEPVFGSIDEYPALIHTAIQELRGRSHQGKIVLIGHSMGGLAIRAYLRDYGCAAVSKAITIGTPHQGTWVGQLGHGKNTKQMRLNTEQRPNTWLNHLRSLETLQQDHMFEVMLSHHDNIVFPQAVQGLGQAPVHEFSGMGHIQMVYSDAVQAKVREVLSRLVRSN